MGYLDYKILAKGLVLTFSAGLIRFLLAPFCWAVCYQPKWPAAKD